MTPFLDASAFGGDAIPAAGTSITPLAGQARFHGFVVFTNWPRGDVEAVLPAGMTLAPNRLAPELHPVVFILGEQTEGALIVAGFRIPTGIRYHEVGVGVPFVRHGQDQRMHTYIARMYSSYFPAVWNGNVHYGFAKQLARMWQAGRDFVAVAEDGAPLLRAEVEVAADWLPGAGCALANFEAMRAVFALPVVGRRASGRSICSRFDWGFEDALVRRTAATVTIDAALGPGLTPRRCAVVPDGGFELRGMLWRLGWPAPCRA